jgi:hypothetical protein
MLFHCSKLKSEGMQLVDVRRHRRTFYFPGVGGTEGDPSGRLRPHQQLPVWGHQLGPGFPHQADLRAGPGQALQSLLQCLAELQPPPPHCMTQASPNSPQIMEYGIPESSVHVIFLADIRTDCQILLALDFALLS